MAQKQEEIIVYKVVSSNDGITFHSFVGQRIAQRGYKIGHKTFPRKDLGPLFAFKDLKSAKRFAIGTFSYTLILKCEASISPRQHKYISTFTNELDITSFWKAIKGKKKPKEMTIGTPEGTVFCDWIKPLELVK